MREAGGATAPPAAALVLPPMDAEERAEARRVAKKTPKPFDLSQPDLGERQERAPVRHGDLVNDAVGADLWGKDWRECGWEWADGFPFSVTRYYLHQRVAVDFPRLYRDVEGVNFKRRLLASQGVAYVAIMPNEALTVDELRRLIQTARAALAKEGTA